MDWMKIAVTLPAQHSQRTNCWKCGGKKTASITNMGKFYVVYCHKCKDKETQDPPPITPQERRALQQAAEAFEVDDPVLPSDFTPDIPLQGLLWLSKGGLHVNDIKTCGFGWSDKLQRVILPVWDDLGTLIAVQARNTGTAHGPKYLGSVWSGQRPVWRSPLDLQGSQTSATRRRGIVLTEDILSAARVGKIAEAWSLLGTNLMPAVIKQIHERKPEETIIWMDDDEAGWNARRTMLRQLGSVGINARAVVSDRDPKHHTLQEMRNLIWNIND